MDTKEKDYNADAILAELRESLKNINKPTLESASTSAVTTNDINEYAYSIDLNGIGISSQDTITLSNTYPYSNTVVSGGYVTGSGVGGGPYTINSGTGTNYANPVWTSHKGSTSISLDGEEADIKVNGWSLCEAIQRLEERLNVLNINPELEKEWDELKELGDRYRALEAKLKEQGKMWQKLKEMPPPKPLY
jgi:hypothetical protein